MSLTLFQRDEWQHLLTKCAKSSLSTALEKSGRRVIGDQTSIHDESVKRREASVGGADQSNELSLLYLICLFSRFRRAPRGWCWRRNFSVCILTAVCPFVQYDAP